MIGLFSNIKRGLFWVLLIVGALSVFANYQLVKHINQLKVANQSLTQTVDSQEAMNRVLANKVTQLALERAQLQVSVDKSANQERHAKRLLSQRIKSLESELEHETCNTQPIRYPAGWVSRY